MAVVLLKKEIQFRSKKIKLAENVRISKFYDVRETVKIKGNWFSSVDELSLLTELTKYLCYHTGDANFSRGSDAYFNRDMYAFHILKE